MSVPLRKNERLVSAAYEVMECMRVLHKSGSNLVAEALQKNEFIEWEHYPPDDVYDPESRAQYYFHAHPVSEVRFSDYGHFHTFLRFDEEAGGSRGSGNPQDPNSGGICHIVGISMTREGLPERLFTVNRWVTGESWRPAAEITETLDRFEIDLSSPSWPLNRWLSAMVVLYRAEITVLLKERDERIASWEAAHPGTDVLEDRALEITSALEISLDRKIKALQATA
ncbi:MAG: hypothetical protein GEU76_09745 [Alphaproteobacteria bacterium]|nr:hypothetical protein [Alphaproteobacteria bacterium]